MLTFDSKVIGLSYFTCALSSDKIQQNSNSCSAKIQTCFLMGYKIFIVEIAAYAFISEFVVKMVTGKCGNYLTVVDST